VKRVIVAIAAAALVAIGWYFSPGHPPRTEEQKARAAKMIETSTALRRMLCNTERPHNGVDCRFDEP
jgi:hypothetical protein